MRRRSSGRFRLPITAGEAIDFFTPEGERSWVPGWNPTYLGERPSESPGTVFMTSHSDTETVWIIEKINRDDYTSAYTRITHGHHAGTVRVTCNDQPEGHCLVDVTYDMTSRSPHEPESLDSYDDESFTRMMNEWATLVSVALRAHHHEPDDPPTV